LFRARGVTVGPILDASSLLRDPHVVARGVYVADAGSGTVMHAVAPRLSGTPGGLRRAAPRCGEHSAEILGELGAAADDLVALTSRRAIRCG
jgi:crotonobetainyl-CoA:carnitine CoA-transferase CaiB-like acyl-CoA transferase